MRLSVTAGVARVYQENGSVAPFVESTSAGWLPPRRVNATLAEDPSSSTARWVFRRGGTEIFTFDSTGALRSIADLSGNTSVLAYSGGELQTVTDDAGRQLVFTWTNGKITKVTAPSTVLKTGGPPQVMEVSYVYGGGDLMSVTDTDGGVWTYTYGGSHRLTTTREPRHHYLGAAAPVVENSYDGTSGKVVWQKDRLGRQTSFGYGPDKTRVTDPNGNVVDYEHLGGICTEIVRDPGPSESRWDFEVDPTSLGRTKVKEITTAQRPEPARVELSAAEEAAALELLRDPDLAGRIVADVERVGVVGEAINVLVAYLAAVSRKLDAPLAVLVQSTSAAGKSS